MIQNKLSHDDGIDFLGSLVVPGQRNFKVIGQCKDEKKRASSSYVREMTGVLSNLGGDAVGMLMHSKGFSENCVQAANLSHAPLILITFNEENGIETIVMNASIHRWIPKLNVGFVLNSIKRKPFLMHKKTVLLQ